MNPPANIIRDTDSLITAAINSLTGGVEKFTSKTSAREVAAKLTDGDLQLVELVEALWQQIENNWVSTGRRRGGEDNWRWELNPEIALNNPSLETGLEKALAGILPKAQWANQVPTSSGLISTHSDKKRNIDLSHWDGAGTVTIIELKVNSNTPVYAAFEIVRNALILCLARTHNADNANGTTINIKAPAIWKEATQAQLRVIAPREFYAGYALGWFEQELDRAVSAFGKAHALEMSFGFRCFDYKPIDEPQLLYALAQKVEWH